MYFFLSQNILHAYLLTTVLFRRSIEVSASLPTANNSADIKEPNERNCLHLELIDALGVDRHPNWPARLALE
jgi:hypothetical protein